MCPKGVKARRRWISWGMKRARAQATALAMPTALPSSTGMTHTERREPCPPGAREPTSGAPFGEDVDLDSTFRFTAQFGRFTYQILAMKLFPTCPFCKNPVYLGAPLTPASNQTGHLLTTRSRILRRALAGVAVNPVNAGGSISALVPHTVIDVDVTPLPNESPEAFTLEVGYCIDTVPMNTGA